jgi:hypothetical protein
LASLGVIDVGERVGAWVGRRGRGPEKALLYPVAWATIGQVGGI